MHAGEEEAETSDKSIDDARCSLWRKRDFLFKKSFTHIQVFIKKECKKEIIFF